MVDDTFNKIRATIVSVAEYPFCDVDRTDRLVDLGISDNMIDRVIKALKQQNIVVNRATVFGSFDNGK